MAKKLGELVELSDTISKENNYDKYLTYFFNAIKGSESHYTIYNKLLEGIIKWANSEGGIDALKEECEEVDFIPEELEDIFDSKLKQSNDETTIKFYKKYLILIDSVLYCSKI